MSRPLRFVPENRDGVLVEVSCRTLEAMPMLRPSRRLNEIIVGVIGRALEVSPVGLCGLSCLSTHYHALLVVDDQQSLTRFMAHFQSNLAREVGRLIGWHGKVWSRRYDAIVVSDEAEAQWSRLRYVLANGTKEGLVLSPYQWPGVHAAHALVEGEPLEGYWFNRTKEWAARRRGEDFGAYDYATRYEVELEPLPSLRHLPAAVYREKVAALVVEIEEDGERARGGREVLGVEAILNQDPLRRPARRAKRSPRPQFHAVSKEGWRELRRAFTEFRAVYLEASEALRSGDLKAVLRFPVGSYPPASPFVGERPPPRPPSPPTRRLELLGPGRVERGEIPVVALRGRCWADAPRARGQPP